MLKKVLFPFMNPFQMHNLNCIILKRKKGQGTVV